jgi:hypothetical protein
MALQKFKTLSQLSSANIVSGLAALGDEKGLKAYQTVLARFGPLALSDYRDLSLGMMKLVIWTKVGEIPTAKQEVDPTGLLKPLSFIDETCSERDNIPVHRTGVERTTISAPPGPDRWRRHPPQDMLPSTATIGGLEGKIEDIYPSLTWGAPTMANLTTEQCQPGGHSGLHRLPFGQKGRDLLFRRALCSLSGNGSTRAPICTPTTGTVSRCWIPEDTCPEFSEPLLIRVLLPPI